MAKGVIDLFKAVEVKEDEAKAAVVAAGGFDVLRERLVEKAAIIEEASS
jgi:hypothetical protein